MILATGGFQGDRELVREHVTLEADDVVLRANPWSTGDGLRLGLARGRPADGRHGRVLGPRDACSSGGDRAREVFRPLGQSYARYATGSRTSAGRSTSRAPGRRSTSPSGSRDSRGAAPGLRSPTRRSRSTSRQHTVGDMIESARAAGAPVERRDGETVVEVVAGITTTLGGLAIDEHARAADGLWAVGADAGGISTGGWTSTLASALVLGLAAAESASA